MEQVAQLPLLLDMTAAPIKSRPPLRKEPKVRKIEVIRTELRQLAEELDQALYQVKPTERPTVHSPMDAFDILAPFMSGLDHEELWILDLDTRNRVVQIVKLYQGSVNQSQVRIAEVFQQAIINKAPSIVLAHNHPSGDPTPSPDDVALTRAVVQAGKLLDIDVLDHLIISAGPTRFISLKERGLGFGQ